MKIKQFVSLILIGAVTATTLLPLQVKAEDTMDAMPAGEYLEMSDYIFESPEFLYDYPEDFDEEQLGSVSVNASVTKENILALMDEYDPDAAFILRYGIDCGDDITCWWGSGEKIIDEIDTAVHEEFHGYTHYAAWSNGHYNAQVIYTGNGEGILTPFTEVFRTSTIASTVPQNLRTFRFGLYFQNEQNNEYLSSDADGAYGLLNEYAAYTRGMTTIMNLQKYMVDNGGEQRFLYNFGNDMQAYAEFKFYILYYLKYAKEHYPAIYQGFINNENFKKAYNYVEKTGYNQISKLLSEYGNDRRLDYYKTPYELLTNEVAGDAYKSVIQDLASEGRKIPDSKKNDDVKPEDKKDDSVPNGSGFSDVGKAWYTKAVDYVAKNNIMSGTGGNKFNPEGSCTRSMFVQILYNMEGKPGYDSYNPFSDVAEGKWYSNSVKWAVQNGVTSGKSSSLFGVNDNVDRQSVAQFLMNYAKKRGYDTTAGADLSKYPDNAAISGWARKAVSWANANGIISGYGNGNLAPNDTCTRAQIAQMIMNFQNIFGR